MNRGRYLLENVGPVRLCEVNSSGFLRCWQLLSWKAWNVWPEKPLQWL